MTQYRVVLYYPTEEDQSEFRIQRKTLFWWVDICENNTLAIFKKKAASFRYPSEAKSWLLKLKVKRHLEILDQINTN